MRLLFDLYTSQGHGKVKFHGGGTYGQNLLVELLLTNHEKLDITIVRGPGVVNSNLDKVLKEKQPSTKEVHSNDEVIEELLSEKYDVFYTSMPYYLEGYKDKIKKCPTKVLGTIHGLREIELSYDKSYRSYLRNPIAKIKQAKKYYFPKKRLENEIRFYKEIIKIVDGHILTVSNHTKHQILNVFPEIKPENILVLNPIDRSTPLESGFEYSNYSLEYKKYFLITSCDRPVKNAFRALSAMNNFPIRRLGEYKICCIGFRAHQKKKIKKNFKNIEKQIVFLDYLKREELEGIIKGAYSFIYPSISEGFGYPPLEAMRNSVPVLASSHTAITEVCGDAVLYYNPFSEREIANRVSQIINEEGLSQKLITKGHERYNSYSLNIGEQIKLIISYIVSGDK